MSVARILIVDDEAALVALLERYLVRLGYEADTAHSGEEALERFESSPDRYACILTDLQLPGMGGEDLLERMRALQPALPAIVSSGHPYQPVSAATVFLQKPYLPGMLAEELGKLLRKASRRASSQA